MLSSAPREVEVMHLKTCGVPSRSRGDPFAKQGPWRFSAGKISQDVPRAMEKVENSAGSEAVLQARPCAVVAVDSYPRV